jgi:hypothetical protein
MSASWSATCADTQVELDLLNEISELDRIYANLLLAQ